MRLRITPSPFVRLLLVPMAAVGVLMTSDVSPDTPQNVCPDTSGTVASSAARVTFGIHMASPFQYEFDSGFFPKTVNGNSSPVGVKAFYYASGGKLDITATGTLTASWSAAQAIPGNDVPLNIAFVGDAPGSQWTTEGGLRAGFRYKIDADIGGLSVQHEDYLPGVPKLDYTWNGSKDILPLSLGVAVPLFSLIWGEGALPCLLEIYLGSRAPDVTCESGSPNPTLDLEIFWGDPEAPDSVGAGDHRFCVQFWPHPSVETHLCVDPGLCTGISWEGVSLTDESSGKAMTAASGEVIPDDSVSVPCDFAQASDQDRIFSFTKGPYDYDAQLQLDLIGKGKPVVIAHFVKIVKATLDLGAAICAAIIPNPILDGTLSMPYSKMDATFEMKIADPFVDDIVVGSGSGFVSALDSADVTWCTTWGAPDACNCRARLDFRFSPAIGSGVWAPWVRMHASEDTLNYGSWRYLFGPACTEAQVRVEFRDPASQTLHTDTSDVFLITPVPAEINPYQADYGVTYVGAQKDQWIAISNPGPNNLLVGVGVACPPEFNVVSGYGGPFVITTGGTHNVLVRFKPSTPGTKTCNLPVTLNGTTCPLPLKGFAQTPPTGIPSLTDAGIVTLLVLITLLALSHIRRRSVGA